MSKLPTGLYDLSLICPKCHKPSLRMSWVEDYCGSRPAVEVGSENRMGIEIDPGNSADYEGPRDHELYCEEDECSFRLDDWDAIEKLLFGQVLETEES